MEGRRRKLDEKKRGVYGVIIQLPPKKRDKSFSFSYAFHIYHFLECRFNPKSVMMEEPRVWPVVVDELLINI